MYLFKATKERFDIKKQNHFAKKCIFCKKDKFNLGTHTRERLIDCAEFKADTRISSSALRHIRTESIYKEAALFVNLICCPACAIKERLGLESVLCVLDQPFYAKAAEVIWKNKDIFGDIVIMLG